MKIINFFFLIFFLLTSKTVFSNDENKEVKFIFTSKDNWKVSCSDIKKKYHNKKALSHEAIIDSLKRKYVPGFGSSTSIWKNAQFSSDIENSVLSIFKLDDDGNKIDVTKKIFDPNDEDNTVFCNEGSKSNDFLIYKTKPIHFFQSEQICESKFRVDNEIIYLLINKHLDGLPLFK